MDVNVNRYESAEGAWTFVYELLADSIVIKQKQFGERRRLLYELKDCADTPDRGIKVNRVPNTRLARIVACIVLSLTVVGFAVPMAARYFFGAPRPGAHHGTELLPAAISVLFAEIVAMAFLLPLLVKKAVPQHWVTFKRRSDGSFLFTIFSAPHQPTRAFEVFVGDVIAAIERQKPDAQPSVETNVRRD